ncbi:MAG: c-type cytochrome [Planctomycetota bacterium]
MRTLVIAWWLLATTTAVGSGWALQDPPAEQEEDEDDDIFPPDFEESLDGEGLYLRHCATCHGVKGDGQGTLELESPARDFAEGGFSFGNSREALFKTITAGLPGRSKMPGFQAYLTEEQRWMVVDHLQTILPEEKTVSATETELRVLDRPVVARGYLPRIADDLPDWPRGLLIGSPDGRSFQYSTDGVRLIAVRMGRFANRRDWQGRGGDPLVPLGERILTFGGGDPGPGFALSTGEGSPVLLSAQFKGTWIRDRRVGLRYEIHEPERPIASVQEEVRVVAVKAGTGFSRILTWKGEPDLLVGVTGGGATEEGWVGRIEPGLGLFLLKDGGESGSVVCFVHQPGGGNSVKVADELWVKSATPGELTLTYLLVNDTGLDNLQTAFEEITQ